jgi:hypothetical protein
MIQTPVLFFIFGHQNVGYAVAHRFANRLLGTVIAIAIQAVIVDSVKWSASARPGPGSHNEVLAHNLVQSEKPLIQPTPTVSLSPFSEPFGSTTVPWSNRKFAVKWKRLIAAA